MYRPTLGGIWSARIISAACNKKHTAENIYAFAALLFEPISPINPEPNNQTAAGTGTAEGASPILIVT